MSKKEQKLKKNLYKALTEYFIHNPKNNLINIDQLLNLLVENNISSINNTLIFNDSY